MLVELSLVSPAVDGSYGAGAAVQGVGTVSPGCGRVLGRGQGLGWGRGRGSEVGLAGMVGQCQDSDQLGNMGTVNTENRNDNTSYLIGQGMFILQLNLLVYMYLKYTQFYICKRKNVLITGSKIMKTQDICSNM